MSSSICTKRKTLLVYQLAGLPQLEVGLDLRAVEDKNGALVAHDPATKKKLEKTLGTFSIFCPFTHAGSRDISYLLTWSHARLSRALALRRKVANIPVSKHFESTNFKLICR